MPGRTKRGLVAKHSSRQWQRDATRDRLTDAALDLFSARGFASVTVEDIATAAGVGRTTFYLHFQTKADVANEIGLRNIDATVGLFRALGEHPPTNTADGIRWLSQARAFARRNEGAVLVATQANVREPALAADLMQVLGTVADEIIDALGFEPSTAPVQVRESLRFMLLAVDRFAYVRYYQHVRASHLFDEQAANLVVHTLDRCRSALAALRDD